MAVRFFIYGTSWGIILFLFGKFTTWRFGGELKRKALVTVFARATQKDPPSSTKQAIGRALVIEAYIFIFLIGLVALVPIDEKSRNSLGGIFLGLSVLGLAAISFFSI